MIDSKSGLHVHLINNRLYVQTVEKENELRTFDLNSMGILVNSYMMEDNSDSLYFLN